MHQRQGETFGRTNVRHTASPRLLNRYGAALANTRASAVLAALAMLIVLQQQSASSQAATGKQAAHLARAGAHDRRERCASSKNHDGF